MPVAAFEKAVAVFDHREPFASGLALRPRVIV